MSNIIRNHSQAPSLISEKKIIGTKKIETKKLDFIERAVDSQQQRRSLREDIEHLDAQAKLLKDQLEIQKQEAQQTIEQWWVEKREEAELEAKRLAEESALQGFQAGYDKGLATIEEQFRQKRQEMNSLIETAYSEKAQIIQQSEPFLLSLSVKIAEKVIKQELKQNEDQLLNIIKQALRQVEEAEDVMLQVALEDYPLVLPFMEELRIYVKADSELKLVPTASLTIGGCMIQTASGSYDATVDSQLEEIRRQMLAYCEEKINDEPMGR
ncbi:flagellar assembly protein FliH [Planococcus sp. CPCC 101016]|uniref:FliH/SctL family protein n=1 Tax=Planococcus sp. CPCC 101016 TaxID=2599617 RepID=UPI0011B3D439|nr:FliH/SctL family protein [Planococcus sp. CPCC 101016]TWT04466.1 flagellar assembly protein FliH [Planococcus sp. CPCC 101016]